jgi:hypothetical protein
MIELIWEERNWKFQKIRGIKGKQKESHGRMLV